MVKINHVTCEHCVHPLSVSVWNPRFSWILESDENHVYQKSYRIVVTGSQGDCVWDSGRVESTQTTEIIYQGEKLCSAARYSYLITVWDEQEQEWMSEENYFETAFFVMEDWKAKWIEPTPLPQLPENPLAKASERWMESLMALMRGEPMTYTSDRENLESLPLEPYDPPVRFRRCFYLEKNPKQAKVYMTAHGIYSFSINGKKIPGTLLSPGFTSYDKRLKYQIYDVTSYLQSGENALSVTVADGWYKGKIAFGRGCEYGEVPGLLFQMEIENTDGTVDRILSDSQFTYSYDGPVRQADLFTGEWVDASLNDGDPSLADYRKDGWNPVLEREYSLENLEAQIAPLVEVYETIPAKSVFIAPNGETIVDFGQNMAGVICVEISEPKGTFIQFEHGEILDENGNFTYAFTGGTEWQRDVYISGGEKKEIFQPEFTYHGFRYVRVTGGKDWRAEQFTAKAISSANPLTGSFCCSDERLNKLQHNIYWSQRSNTITIPTDCPTREKAGWTGDVVVYGATALYNQNMNAFFEDWLTSIRKEQRENGHVLNTVPQIQSYVQQSMGGSLGWGDVIITLPWQLYILCGNRKAIECNYEAMEKWMDAMKAAAKEIPQNAEGMNERQLDNQQYLINTGFHFGDWLVPSVKNEQGFSDGVASSFLTMNVVDTAILAADADLMADISMILGKEEKASEYKRYAKRVREAFQEELCGDEGRLLQEMQGNYILALSHHMVPERQEPLFAKRLEELILKNGGRPDTGFMSVPWILDVLCDNGYRELAWKVLNQNQCPGWMYEIEKGATTMWENWDAIRPDGKVDGCSFNHYAFGCVGDFLYRRVLGIQNAGVGYDKIRLEPGYDFDLNWAEGSYESVHGTIYLKWEKKESEIVIDCRIPTNTTAILVLPDGTEKEIGNGAFTIRR